MPDDGWHITLPPDSTITMTPEKMARFDWTLNEMREWLNLKMLTGKYTFRFAVELALHSIGRIYNVHTIFDELGVLEGSGGLFHGTKSAAPFTRPPLEGLWHKHHHQAAFMARNLLNEWMKPGYVRDLVAPYFGRQMDEQVAGELAHKFVIDTFFRRSAAGRLTGQFIVYERLPDGANYYLTLGEHGDWEAIRARVDSYKRYDEEIGFDRRRNPPDSIAA